MELQLDVTITVLLISKISSTCFGQTFAHLQERKTEIFFLQHMVQCSVDVAGRGSGRCSCLTSYRRRSVKLQRSEPLPAISTGHYTTCCKKNSVLRSWRWAKVCPKHVGLILEINKTVIVASSLCSILLYLHWWCTVKHKSNFFCLRFAEWCKSVQLKLSLCIGKTVYCFANNEMYVEISVNNNHEHN
jgi:hypothetical protein